MVRATRIFEVIDAEQLIPAAATRGAHLLAGLQAIADAHPGAMTNVRGRGLMCAFDVANSDRRDRMVAKIYRDHHVLVLPCGERSVRFRPPLSVTEADIDCGLAAVAAELVHDVPVAAGQPW
jgi:L-lysine 6-transaminase